LTDRDAVPGPAGPTPVSQSAAKVSVVVPCYNQASFLHECLASLRRQSIGAVEVVIVNDGSDDPAMPDALRAARAEGATVIDQENRGLAAARNRGFEESTGTYVQFLDADDLIEPEKLERQVAVLERDSRVGVCTSDYVLLDHASGVRHHEGATRSKVTDDPLRDFLLRWESELSIPIHAALFRRSVLEGMAPLFDRRLRGKEDWLFWVRVARSGATFQHVDRVLAVYRVHARSMSRRSGEMGGLAVTATALIAHEIDDDGLLGEFAALQGERIARQYLGGATVLGGSSDVAPRVPLRYRAIDAIYLRLKSVRWLARAFARVGAPWKQR